VGSAEWDAAARARGGGPVQADEERHCVPPWNCETLPRESPAGRSLTGALGYVQRERGAFTNVE